LWDVDVPGKAKIHVWRLIKNGLAVGDELQRRHVKGGVKCIVCHKDELLLQRFWRCPHLASVWEIARDDTGLMLQSPDQTVNRQRELHGWILDRLGNLSGKEISSEIMILYQLWLARNNARDDAKVEEPEAIVR
jgi:hypothetical protein